MASPTHLVKQGRVLICLYCRSNPAITYVNKKPCCLSCKKNREVALKNIKPIKG